MEVLEIGGGIVSAVLVWLHDGCGGTGGDGGGDR
jgi:hypothetical protein